MFSFTLASHHVPQLAVHAPQFENQRFRLANYSHTVSCSLPSIFVYLRGSSLVKNFVCRGELPSVRVSETANMHRGKP